MRYPVEHLTVVEHISVIEHMPIIEHLPVIENMPILEQKRAWLGENDEKAHFARLLSSLKNRLIHESDKVIHKDPNITSLQAGKKSSKNYKNAWFKRPIEVNENFWNIWELLK